jgi:hypothetical protein
MSKHEAILILKEYNKKGISSYVISKNNYKTINSINKGNTSSLE